LAKTRLRSDILRTACFDILNIKVEAEVEDEKEILLSASSVSSSSVTAATSVVSETAAPSFPPAFPLSSSDSAASVVPPHVPVFLNHFNNALRRISATAASKPSNVVDEKEANSFWLRSCKLRA
jgi:hypothetical protein